VGRVLREPAVFDALVGMGGGGSALNATNTVRTTLFFACSSPPHFLNATSVEDIQSLQSHGDGNERLEGAGACGAPSGDSFVFGDGAFRATDELPLVVFENYVEGSVSIHSKRVGCAYAARRLVIGHENNGVHHSYLPPCGRGDAAVAWNGMVVYVPQYGTSSSLNVVTCLGIGLFYSYLDATFPASRTLLQQPQDGGGTSDAFILQYTRSYSLMLPHDTTAAARSAYVPPAQDRVDRRPIHPMFYLQSEADILARHRRFLDALYQRKIDLAMHTGVAQSFRPLQRSLISQRPLFGLSVLYENEVDQRNLGGLLRNANAFLVDHIFYTGRRKLNIKGAVGSQHYSRPIFLGPCPPLACDDAVDEDAIGDFLRHVDATLCATVNSENASRVKFLLLSTGQEFLYTSHHSASSPFDEGCLDAADTAFVSHPASLDMYAALCAGGPASNICLTQTEASLWDAFAGDGSRYVVLLIPQEGKLPHPALMRRVEGIVHVTPPDGRYHRGLPSQVAGGIALARWCSVVHPELRW
jgi:hypothetical protein